MCERLLRMDGTWYTNSPSREFLEDRFHAATLSEEDCLLAKAIRDADRERARLALSTMLNARVAEMMQEWARMKGVPLEMHVLTKGPWKRRCAPASPHVYLP